MSKKAPEGTTHISVNGFLKKDEQGDMWFFNNYGVWQRWTRSLRSDWMVIENRSAVEVGLRAHIEAVLARAERDAEKAFDAKVERVAMHLLGKKDDPAPGVDWYCDRSWTVNDVRALVRSALEAEEQQP